MFHRHNWSETYREYQKPVNREVDVRGPAVDTIMNRALFGFTLIELRCTECGDITWRELPGRSGPCVG